MLFSKPHQLVHLLSSFNLTIATAESCTGGLISSLITDVPGASKVYLGSVVAYSSRIKAYQLGVPADILEKYTAISPQVAICMAQNVRKIMTSDISVAVTGNLGPTVSEGKEFGEIYIAVCTGEGEKYICKKLNTGNILERKALKDFTALNALDLVINAIRREV